MNVVLIGFSGAGKSTVGKLLAERLGWGFVDTDESIEQGAGKPIHRIFAEDGEPAFRRLERDTLSDALRGDRRVIAVGGGAVTDPVSRYRMRDGNLVLLLEAEVPTLHGRLASAVVDEPRPMLYASNPLSRIESLKATRDPLYREVAHVIVSTEGLDVDGVVERIIASVFDSHHGQPSLGVER